jgi:hypothetical protein
MFFFFLEVLVCVYIYINKILLRVISSLGGTLTIFYNLGGTLSQLKGWRHCQFGDNLRGVYGLSPKIKVI